MLQVGDKVRRKDGAAFENGLVYTVKQILFHPKTKKAAAKFEESERITDLDYVVLAQDFKPQPIKNSVRSVLLVIRDLESVFSFARTGVTRMDIQGRNVSIGRMECYAVHGTKCQCCDRTGTELRLELWGDGGLHLDLYGFEPDGSDFLMTRDHIMPKSKGGRNTIANYQPMCQYHNSEKGSVLPHEFKASKF